MRYENIYSTARALPRMSWAGINLYNLWQRSKGAASGPDETTFRRTFLSLFQQRWKAKRLVRGYHGDYIGEKKFKKWYLPELIPDVRPRRAIGLGHRSIEALKLGGRSKEAAALERNALKEDWELASAPVGSLMFLEVEKRIDTVVFRACLATSVYQARHLVLTGKVTLNGVTCRNPGKRLEPGDLVSVDPNSISFLQKPEADEQPEAETPIVAVETAADTETSETLTSTIDTEEGQQIAESLEQESSEEHESKYRSKQTARQQSLHSQSINQLGYPLHLPDYAAPFIFIPAYLEVSFVTCSAVYVRDPTARKNLSELPTPYDADGELMRLAWEWYVKVRPRMRGRLQRETGPHGTRRPVPYWSQYQQ